MSTLTISGVSSTPWTFYNADLTPGAGEPATDAGNAAIYTLMSQYAAAADSVKTQSADLVTQTAKINTNNKLLAMLNGNWNGASLIPWPTDSTEQYQLTQKLLATGIVPAGGGGLFDGYQYNTTSWNAFMLGTTDTIWAGASSIQLDSASLTPLSVPPNQNDPHPPAVYTISGSSIPSGTPVNVNVNGQIQQYVVLDPTPYGKVSYPPGAKFVVPVVGANPAFIANPSATTLANLNAQYVAADTSLNVEVPPWPQLPTQSPLVDFWWEKHPIYAVYPEVKTTNYHQFEVIMDNAGGLIPWPPTQQYGWGYINDSVMDGGGRNGQAYVSTDEPAANWNGGRWSLLYYIDTSGYNYTEISGDISAVITPDKMTQIMNNQATLLRAGVTLNTMGNFDMLGIAPPGYPGASPNNAALDQKWQPAGGYAFNSWSKPPVTTPLSNAVRLNDWVNAGPVFDLSVSQYNQLWQQGGVSSLPPPPPGQPALYADARVRNPDGSYGVVVQLANGNWCEYSFAPFFLNPQSTQIADWKAQIGAPNACLKTEALLADASGNTGLASSQLSPDFNMAKVTYYLDPQHTPPARTGYVGLKNGYPNVPGAWYVDTYEKFVSNPGAAQVQKYQNDLATSNSTLSNDAQAMQNQLQVFFATLTAASQAVATILSTWSSLRQDINHNM